MLHLIPVLRAPESPNFLYTQKRYDELREALSTIAYSNGAVFKEIKFLQELYEEEGPTPEVISMLDALKDPVYLKNLIIMTLNWSVCSV